MMRGGEVHSFHKTDHSYELSSHNCDWSQGFHKLHVVLRVN